MDHIDVKGGHFDAEEIERGILKPGQWTDDTSMALCLADSLALRGKLDGSDVRLRPWDRMPRCVFMPSKALPRLLVLVRRGRSSVSIAWSASFQRA